MSPTPEVVLRARAAKQRRLGAEQHRRYEENERRRQEKKAAEHAVFLARVGEEAKAAMKRLAAKDYPDGRLEQVVTSQQEKRTWWGRRYDEQTTEERACWPLYEEVLRYTPLSNPYSDPFYLTSDLQVVSRSFGGRNRNGYGLEGLYPVNLESWNTVALQDLIKVLERLGA